MRLLLLGGTVFVGRALVNAAQERGHSVTLFNRGRTNPELFPEVEKIHGDRTIDLSSIEGCCWDAVIDTSGYLPRVVHLSASYLANKVDHYTFISSLSVYSDTGQAGIDENGAVGQLEDETVETINNDTYGPLKVLCERAAENAMPGQVLMVRPGVIVGPHDPSDRFTYWPHRVALGGEVLAPGRPQRAVQFIDSRDLAEWIIRMVEDRETGVFNANGPAEPLPMGKLLDTCRDVSKSQADFIWTSEDFLLENKVGPWVELPLWVPEKDPATAGFLKFSSRKALEKGLTFRPLKETISDTLRWEASRPSDYHFKAGLSAAREAELIQAWKKLH